LPKNKYPRCLPVYIRRQGSFQTGASGTLKSFFCLAKIFWNDWPESISLVI